MSSEDYTASKSAVMCNLDLESLDHSLCICDHNDEYFISLIVTKLMVFLDSICTRNNTGSRSAGYVHLALLDRS